MQLLLRLAADLPNVRLTCFCTTYMCTPYNLHLQFAYTIGWFVLYSCAQPFGVHMPFGVMPMQQAKSMT